MTFILGLTGGIASGKSTVSHYLNELGAGVVDADKVARMVVEPDTPGLAKIVSYFGTSILNEDGSLNRKKLGELVFSDAKKLDNLMQITGPLIRTEISNQVEQFKKGKVKLIVLDIPLLFEGKYDDYCDAVMVVNIPSEVQTKRIIQRDKITLAQAKQRINSQLDASERCKLATVVIDNSKAVEDTQQQVLKWLKMNDLDNL